MISKSLEKATRSSRKCFEFSAKLINLSEPSKTSCSILKSFVNCKKKSLLSWYWQNYLENVRKKLILLKQLFREQYTVWKLSKYFFWLVFSRSQFKYGKIQTRINSVFAQFSSSDTNLHRTSLMLLPKPNSYHTDYRLNDINFDKEIILKIIQ